MTDNVATPIPIFYRCDFCEKKVFFSGKCKCSKYFCDKHRYNHDCSFSYFVKNKTELEKRNIKIDSDKIIRL